MRCPCGSLSKQVGISVEKNSKDGFSKQKEPRPVPSVAGVQPQAEGTVPSAELSVSQERLNKRLPKRSICNKLKIEIGA
jgi:hypothetical protein